jgi:hypothetical protein
MKFEGKEWIRRHHNTKGIRRTKRHKRDREIFFMAARVFGFDKAKKIVKGDGKWESQLIKAERASRSEET